MTVWCDIICCKINQIWQLSFSSRKKKIKIKIPPANEAFFILILILSVIFKDGWRKYKWTDPLQFILLTLHQELRIKKYSRVKVGISRIVGSGGGDVSFCKCIVRKEEWIRMILWGDKKKWPTSSSYDYDGWFSSLPTTFYPLRMNLLYGDAVTLLIGVVI